MLFLLAFTLTISGDMDALELSSIASRMARSNIIERGERVRFDFSRAPDIKICRGDRGHPYFCKVFVFSSPQVRMVPPENYVELPRWTGYELDVCEEFNEI